MTHSMQILMLVNTYPYDDSRVMIEAATLQQSGYLVTIIGAARNTGSDAPMCGSVDGITILLTPMIITRNPIQLLRAFWAWVRGQTGDISPASRFRKTNVISLLFFNLWCWRLGCSISAKVIHCHDFSPLPAARLLAWARHIPFIYDSHESAADMYTGTKARLVESLERNMMRQADCVITVGERLKAALQKRGAKEVVVIGNWKDTAEYTLDSAALEAERERLHLPESNLIVSYLGSLNPHRNLEELVDAAAKSPEITLLVSGKGPLEHRMVSAAQQFPNIHWLGWLKRADVALYTQLSDVVYCCIHTDQYQSTYVVPNKLFEAFAAGKALIASKGVGEMSEILETIPAAILLEDVTVAHLIATFQQLQDPDTLSRLQQAALQGREQYNWQVAETRLLELYEELTRVNATN